MGLTSKTHSEPVPQENTGVVGSDFWDSDDEWVATVIGSTEDGKDVQVVKRQDGQGYEISFRQGGEKPAALNGWFTSYDKAEQAARIYLNRRLEEK